MTAEDARGTEPSLKLKAEQEPAQRKPVHGNHNVHAHTHFSYMYITSSTPTSN